MTFIAHAFITPVFIAPVFIAPVVAALLGASVLVPLGEPVEGPVVRRFDAPACPYCAGHRGITVATEPGSPVVAVADGRITFSGEVAGVRYVVLEVGPGVLLTHGGLARIENDIVAGVEVSVGTPLARSSQSTHLGVRIDGQYRDPLVVFGWGSPRLIGPGGIDVATVDGSR